jgi:hypothetical protein
VYEEEERDDFLNWFEVFFNSKKNMGNNKSNDLQKFTY